MEVQMKFLYNKIYITFFIILVLASFTLLYASDDIGQYRVQLSTCSTLQDAQTIQQQIESFQYMSLIASLNQSTTVYISQSDTGYKVFIGNYPTLGEAHFVANMFADSVYKAVIQQIQLPIPNLNTISGSADVIYSQATASYHAKQYAQATVY